MMSGFLESDTTHSMTKVGNNTTSNHNTTIASGGNNFESDEEEQHANFASSEFADFASSEFEAGEFAATDSSSTNRADNSAQPIMINNCTNLDYSQLVKLTLMCKES